MQIFCFICGKSSLNFQMILSVFITFIQRNTETESVRALEKGWNKSRIQLPGIWWVNKNVSRNQIKIGKGRPSRHIGIGIFVEWVVPSWSRFAMRFYFMNFPSSSALDASWRFNFMIFKCTVAKMYKCVIKSHKHWRLTGNMWLNVN